MQPRAAWILVPVVAVSLVACGKRTGSDQPATGAAGVPAEGSRGAQGTTYRAPSGEFTIQLPEEPEMREEADGRTVYQVRTQDYAFIVNKLACPAEFAGDTDPTALYDDLRVTAVRAVDGQAMSEYPVRSAGRTLLGRELVVHATTKRTAEPYEMVVRLFRDGDAVWLLQAIGPRTPKSRADRVGVLDTFRLL